MTFDLNQLPVGSEDSPEPTASDEGYGRRSRKSDSADDTVESPVRAQRIALVRHIAFLALALVFIGVGLWRRDEMLEYLGWSLVPMGGWALVFVYLLFTRTSWIMSRLRSAASSLLICLGGGAVLGIFDAPLGAVSGATMGGMLGEFLAREPFDWDRYNIVLWQQLQGWARAFVLFGLGVALQFPSGSAAVAKITAVGLMILMSSAISFMSSSATFITSIASKLRSSTSSVRQTPSELEDGGPSSDVEDPQFVPVASTVAASYSSGSSFDPYVHRESPAVADPLERVVIGLGQTVYAKPMTESDRTSPPSDLQVDRIETKPLAESDWVPTPVNIGEDQMVTATLDQPQHTEEFDGSVMLTEVPRSNQDEIEVGIQPDPDGMTVEEDALTSLDLLELEGDGTMLLSDESVLEKPPLEEPASIGKATRVEAAINDFPWYLPPVDFMAEPPGGGVTASEIESTSRLIEETLAQHAVDVTVDQVRVGPTITMYGLKPGWKGTRPNSKAVAQRVRVDAILNREKDIALALMCPNIRFESVVPGASVVGIEVPNAEPTPVNLRSVIDTTEWEDFVKSAALPVPLGMGSGGEPIMADFAKMPHTLVAGATGSGKSVCMNTIVSGLLLCRTPLEVRMVMIDPKRVELTPYQGVPHLYTPVVVEAERAVAVLKALTREMMDRFATLESAGVKNISTYNDRAETKMPYLVVLVDELADLMLTASNEVEQLLVRLAQLGRATGVHLIVATQRPSVDVVTGLIKANFPSRISFSVMSQVDSRTILDSNGAEKLLGKGDMLYKPIDLSKPVRVQGAYLDESEIESIVGYWVRAGSPPLPQLDVDSNSEEEIPGVTGTGGGGDSLVSAAMDLARDQKTLSTSLLQRRLKIGYPRAARLMDELEDAGIVGPGEPGKPRKVLQR